MLEFLFATYVNAQEPEIVSPVEPTVVLEEQEEVSESSFVSISDPKYPEFRASVDAYLPKGSFCALFVNRMLTLRYDIPVYGDAWTMQLHHTNKQWLDLKWRLPETEFSRKNRLSLFAKEDRIKHYRDLYKTIDAEKDPQGVVGFVYYFSVYRDELSDSDPRHTLAQTHVGYLGGRQQFAFTNDSEQTKTLLEVVTDQYGVIHEYEYDFLNEKVRLSTLLESGDSYFYEDYLIEENYKGVRHGSLLAVFLRKHRNNHVTPLLRPVSYSQISDELRESVGAWN